MNTRHGQLLLILAALAMVACRNSTPPPSPPGESGPEPWFPSTETLLSDPTGTSMESSTVLVVTRGTSVVTIRDEKVVIHRGNGDFSLTTRRIHQGSEAGDTIESFQAIRLGRDFWTRGSGGPWVHWDDPLHEPRTTLLQTAGESGDLLEMLTPCTRVNPGSDGQDLELGTVGCQVSSKPGDAPFEAAVSELSGRVALSEGVVVSVEIEAVMDMAAAGHVARANLTHGMQRRTLEDPVIEPPADVISSRRPRPVTMVREILTGLVKEWGPGAPDVIKKK